MRVTDKYHFFWSGPFSQWHPCKFEVAELTFNCTEQYMMYCKAMTFGDKEMAAKIMDEPTPSAQKAMGRKVKGYDQQKWDEVKLEIVTQGNIYKFDQNEDLREILLKTGDKTLVEASPYDKIWGIGLGEFDPKCEDESQWQGENLLGIALMKVRDEYFRFWILK